MEFDDLVRMVYPDAYLAIMFGEKAKEDQYRVFLPSTKEYLGKEWVYSKEIAWRNAWDLRRVQSKL